MRIHITKPRLALIAVLTAILILGLISVSVSADTSLNVTAGKCNCDCNTMNMHAAMPDCCSMSESASPDCGFNSVPENGAILPGSSVPNWNIDDCRHTQIIPAGVDNDSKQFREQELPQLLSPGPCSEYHCRNSLDSEVPILS